MAVIKRKSLELIKEYDNKLFKAFHEMAIGEIPQDSYVGQNYKIIKLSEVECGIAKVTNDGDLQLVARGLHESFASSILYGLHLEHNWLLVKDHHLKRPVLNLEEQEEFKEYYDFQGWLQKYNKENKID